MLHSLRDDDAAFLHIAIIYFKFDNSFHLKKNLTLFHRELFRLAKISADAKKEEEEEEFQRRKMERAREAEVFSPCRILLPRLFARKNHMN